MIITEKININGKEFIYNRSSLGYYIERDGVKYEEAIDLIQNNYVYTETNELIKSDEQAELEM